MLGSKKNSTNGLNIIIVGCGKVGATLTETLRAEGHNITIIDKSAEKVGELSNLYDVMGIVGNGASYSIQMEAGIQSTDLLIAVTESDELNLLCCTVAKQVAGCSAIARVRTPDYSTEVDYLQDKLGLAMIINPDLEAAREIARILYLPSALEVNSFAHGQAELIKFKVPSDSKLDGLSVMQMSKTFSMAVLVCVVERNGEIIIPNGSFVIQSDDVLSFVCQRKNVKPFLDNIGVNTKRVKNTTIAGGGADAYYLAKQLIHMGIDVKIIEKDKARCEELSILLPKAIIINGDGANEDLLLEEGIESCQSFVPLTGIDEKNVLLNLFVKKISKAKTITKISDIRYKDVLDNLELGSVLYPKFITSEAIIAYVRAKKNSNSGSIETLYHMYDSRVEAIEFRVSSGDNVTRSPIMQLNIKKNLLLAFINRNGQIITPTGKDVISAGDTVMVVTTITGLTKIDDILN